MTKPIGRYAWAIAEGYIPPGSTGTTRELTSHETVCILNAADEDAHVSISVYFANREPAGPYKFTCGARRTLHLRFNDFTDPEPVPKGTDFSSIITSTVPVVMQHTRLDTRQPALALMSTMAFPLDA
jgi:hypothetical protein